MTPFNFGNLIKPMPPKTKEFAYALPRYSTDSSGVW